MCVIVKPAFYYYLRVWKKNKYVWIWVASKPDFVFFLKFKFEFGSPPSPISFFVFLWTNKMNSNLGHPQTRIRFCLWNFKIEFGSPPSPILFFTASKQKIYNLNFGHLQARFRFLREIQIRIWVTSKPDFALYFCWKNEFEFGSHPNPNSFFCWKF